MRAVSSVDCSLNDFERAFVEAYCPCREISICDIGSSTGREAIALHGMGFHHVWPIDRDAGMVVVAHRRAADQRIGLPVTRACAEALPFSDRSFDVVLMTCNLYGYIPSHALRVQALREVHRVLKPGGLAFLAVTSRYRSWRTRTATWLLDLGRRVRNPGQTELGNRPVPRRLWPQAASRPMIHWFRPHEVPDDAARVGLQVVCSSTHRAFLKDPRASATSWHWQGWLLHVLRRPAT